MTYRTKYTERGKALWVVGVRDTSTADWQVEEPWAIEETSAKPTKLDALRAMDYMLSEVPSSSPTPTHWWYTEWKVECGEYMEGNDGGWDGEQVWLEYGKWPSNDAAKGWS
jgi:hypothetical protein